MSNKGKGGKKHRRGKNMTQTHMKIDLPDEFQYFGYVTKILGSGRVNLDYYIPKHCEKTNKILDWIKNSKIGVIRGKMMKRVFVNLGDIVLVTERDFDAKKVDIIEKYQASQMGYLKRHVELPPLTDSSSATDVQFEFEGEGEEDDIKNDNSNKNEDYMSGIPTFNDSDDEIKIDNL